MEEYTGEYKAFGQGFVIGAILVMPFLPLISILPSLMIGATLLVFDLLEELKG